nr:50S ribosomal protein L6P [uncultured archaeon]
MKKSLHSVVEVPVGVVVSRDGMLLKVKGSKSESSRLMDDPSIVVEISSTAVTLSHPRATKREKSKMFSLRAHLRNLIKFVQSPAVYKLKICASHFPVSVTVQKNVLSMKNFVGEKVPRLLPIPQNVDVRILLRRMVRLYEKICCS